MTRSAVKYALLAGFGTALGLGLAINCWGLAGVGFWGGAWVLSWDTPRGFR